MPATQSAHESARAPLYLPGTQSVHALPFANVPAPQLMQLASPAAATFSVLSTSVDRGGKVYVAQVEGRDGLPIYGNQFHPEKIEFVKTSSRYPNIPRGPDAVAFSRHLAKFFVSEAAKSEH